MSIKFFEKKKISYTSAVKMAEQFFVRSERDNDFGCGVVAATAIVCK